MTRPPSSSTLFPYTTLFRSVGFFVSMRRGFKAGGRSFDLSRAKEVIGQVTQLESGFCHVRLTADVRNLRAAHIGGAAADRKSTRLNSSHLGISYAVFCLKKK